MAELQKRPGSFPLQSGRASLHQPHPAILDAPLTQGPEGLPILYRRELSTGDFRPALEELFVGIDVSKARLDVALRPSDENFSVANNPRGIASLVKRLRSCT